MEKLCDCGCGKPTPIATITSTKYGRIKGQPLRFILGHAGRLRKQAATCPQGHPLSGDNLRVGGETGTSESTGKAYRRITRCDQCLKQASLIRRASPEGRTERAIEALKRQGVPSEELLRAKASILKFWYLPIDERRCPICGDNCSEKKKFAADHNHTTKRFRAMICQLCNAAIGYSREREDLLGNGRLGQYLAQHQGDMPCQWESYERGILEKEIQ